MRRDGRVEITATIGPPQIMEAIRNAIFSENDNFDARQWTEADARTLERAADEIREGHRRAGHIPGRALPPSPDRGAPPMTTPTTETPTADALHLLVSADLEALASAAERSRDPDAAAVWRRIRRDACTALAAMAEDEDRADIEADPIGYAYVSGLTTAAHLRRAVAALPPDGPGLRAIQLEDAYRCALEALGQIALNLPAARADAPEEPTEP